MSAAARTTQSGGTGGTQQQIVPLMEPIHVLGAGSIGLLFASSIRIAFPSYPITMLLRDHHAPKLEQSSSSSNNNKQYMNVCLSQNRRPRVVRVRAELISSTTTTTTRRHQPMIQNLLVTTKAPDARKAIESIMPRLSAEAKITILCNGAMAVRQELSELLHLNNEDDDSVGQQHNSGTSRRQQLRLATTTHGAYRDTADDDDDELYHVTHAGIGTTFVDRDEAALAQLWDQSGLRCSTTNEMELILWKKLAANCTINPVTSISDCLNGALTEDPYFQQIAPRVLAELSKIAMASVRCSSSEQQLSQSNLHSFVDTVVSDTRQNTSSMRQDILSNRRTEIDYLNGFLVEQGKALNIPTPANDELVERIRELEGWR